MCRLGSMEGKIRKRIVKGKQVIGLLGRILMGMNVSMKVKSGPRNGIVLQTLSYASETWI